MSFVKTSRLSMFIFGGIASGIIATVGFLLLSPSTDSPILFVLLRVALGAVVAIVVGPIVVK